MPKAVRPTVQVILDRHGGKWRATLASDPQKSVFGHNSRTARRLITQWLQRSVGSGVRIRFQIILPDKQTAALEHYRSEAKQRRSRKSAPPSRIGCARELLALHLTQEEVAKLMGITRGLLAVSLQRGDKARDSDSFAM